MYKAISATPENLVKLVEQTISTSPRELDGFLWAAELQEWYCERLNISDRTLRRWVKDAPFVRQCAQVDGRKLMFLRVGDPGPETPRHTANKMSCFWRAKTGLENTRREYGCLCGLAEVWPPGEQVKIFKLIIKEWSAFMSCVKARIMEMEDDGEDIVYRFYEFPSISVIRRFHDVAHEVYTMHVQATGNLF